MSVPRVSPPRLLWIAFNKNSDNDKCLFPLLPKDIILEIIKFFKTDLRLDNFSRTDYQQLNKEDENDIDVDHDHDHDNVDNGGINNNTQIINTNNDKNESNQSQNVNLTMTARQGQQVNTNQDPNSNPNSQNDDTNIQTSISKFHCCCRKR